jgi:cytochrome b561
MARGFRYHPLLVTLHWALAAALIALLATGFFVLGPTANGDPHKIAVLRIHMLAGIAILNLMIVRLVVRVWTAKPAPGATGAPLLERIAPIAHYGFYALVVLMVMTGFATALLAGGVRSMFQGSASPLPPTFAAYPTFQAHLYLGEALVCLIALHVLAALYHQFVRGDGLLRRMTFGRGAADTPAE